MTIVSPLRHVINTQSMKEQHSNTEALNEETHPRISNKGPQYLGNYEIFQTIGTGAFATVKLASHRLTHQQVIPHQIGRNQNY
jgi:serine/threonine protein kinase